MRMTVEDIFEIADRGTIVTGTVSEDSRHVGAAVEIIKPSGARLSSRVTGIEMSRKTLDIASEGDNVGLLLRGIQGTQVELGDVIVSVSY